MLEPVAALLHPAPVDIAPPPLADPPSPRLANPPSPPLADPPSPTLANPLSPPLANAPSPTPQEPAPPTRQSPHPRPSLAATVVLLLAVGWAAEFGWLAVQRHLAGGSNAEDLGFTDQVLGNFLRGHWFRMSIYQGATWNTELDIGRLAHPDSLLAFHFEPMLLLLVPLYAVGGGAVGLLVLQALALASGAVPAYRLGVHAARSSVGGVAVAVAYLLSPLGQWAALADFHTAAIAAPLLILSVERLVVGHSAHQALAAAAFAATAREDVGLVVAALGVAVLVHHCFAKPKPTTSATSSAGLALLAFGLAWTLLAGLVIRMYSGGVLPFDVRYGATIGAGLGGSLAALGRPTVLGNLAILGLSGGWLGCLSPLALLPALPGLALNALSTSPWMAAGKAHYSSLILPWIVVGAAAGLRRLAGTRGTAGRARSRLVVQTASAALVATSLVGYVLQGAGPVGGNYAPARVTPHAERAAALADSLPADATISATSALVPRISRRPHVYVFPAVLDADYVFVDLQASPAPTSAGDVFLRIQQLLSDGAWQVQTAEDGLVLLQRRPDDVPVEARAPDLSRVLASTTDESASLYSSSPVSPLGHLLDGRVSLLSAMLLSNPDGAVDVDGPRWMLRTTWRAEQPLPSGTRLEYWIDQRDGQQRHAWDLAALWWNPPERWTPGEPVTIDIPDVPVRQFLAWHAVFSLP